MQIRVTLIVNIERDKSRSIVTLLLYFCLEVTKNGTRVDKNENIKITEEKYVETSYQDK